MIAALALAVSLFWPHGPGTAGAVREAGVRRVFVPDAEAAEWRSQGFDAQPASALAEYEKVPAPRMQMRTNIAAATSVPWIDANGWRFQRGLKKAFYADLPAQDAPVALAEAHAYGVDVVLAATAETLPAIAPMLRFIDSIGESAGPPIANIGIVDNGASAVDEVLNLLGRRNLLYRVVKTPDSSLDLNIAVGSKEWPAKEAANPAAFAALVREKLTDERRKLRIFGTYNVLGYLAGGPKTARLHLINYGRRPAVGVHVRVLGPYSRCRVHDSSGNAVSAADFRIHEGGAEFTIPSIATYTVIDLEN